MDLTAFSQKLSFLGLEAFAMAEGCNGTTVEPFGITIASTGMTVEALGKAKGSNGMAVKPFGITVEAFVTSELDLAMTERHLVLNSIHASG